MRERKPALLEGEAQGTPWGVKAGLGSTALHEPHCHGPQDLCCREFSLGCVWQLLVDPRIQT